jgi:ribosomal protein L7/L12
MRKSSKGMWIDVVASLLEGAIEIAAAFWSARDKDANKLSLARKAELDIRLRHPEELQRLLHERQTIRAIKLYRDETKATLKEAKCAIEMMQDETSVTQRRAKIAESNSADLKEVWYQLQEGNKIKAIKVYREITGVGLREAKEAVDGMAEGIH